MGEKGEKKKDKRIYLQKTLSSFNNKKISWAEKEQDRASLQLKTSKEQARKCKDHEQADCFTWKCTGATVLSKAPESKILFYSLSGKDKAERLKLYPVVN